MPVHLQFHKYITVQDSCADVKCLGDRNCDMTLQFEGLRLRTALLPCSLRFRIRAGISCLHSMPDRQSARLSSACASHPTPAPGSA